MGKRRPKSLTGVDPVALAELRAAAIARRIERGPPLTRAMQGWFDESLAAALVKRGAVLALAMHQKILQRGLNGTRGWERALGQKSADALLDRALGRPTERVQLASRVTVIMPGLDPSLLPDALPKPKAVEAKPVPKPAPLLPAAPQDLKDGEDG